jgi:signal transduction histidine kinase
MILSGEEETLEQVRGSARVIAEQTDRMTRIVRQLLDFARRRNLDKQSVDLAELCRRTVSLLQPLARRGGVRLDGPAPGPTLRVEADPSQLQQALTNLVVNALQVSPREKRVSVELLEHRRPPASGFARRVGACAEISVSDEGPGISPEHLPAIFDPFFTTKPVGEGTGLGLPVATGIVEEHGGWIDVTTEPGRGSRFGLWLPCEGETCTTES